MILLCWRCKFIMYAVRVLLLLLSTISFFLKAPDEEFEEYLRHLLGERCTGDRNEVKWRRFSYC